MDTKNNIFLVALVAGCAALPPPKPDFSSFFTHSDPASRIVGGTPAAEGTHTHMAALRTGRILIHYLCGSSILTNRHLLTAAHCIPSSANSLTVSVGNVLLNAGTIYSIRRAISHPDYDPFLIKNDVAILVTSSSIAFGPTVQPIAISNEFIGGGVLSRVAGWGRTAHDGIFPTTLLEVDVTTLDGDQCVRDALTAQSQLSIMGPPISPDIELCTFRAPGFGVCHSDSGSPLVKVDSNEQIGVVSWGFPCAVGAPDVFARVSAYRDWIQANIGNRNRYYRYLLRFPSVDVCKDEEETGYNSCCFDEEKNILT